MAPKTKEFTPMINSRNWTGEIQNPVKEFVPLEERTNREITLTPIDTTLADILGWDQEANDWLKEIKKASPLHRRNRKNNKSRNTRHVKYMRDTRRPGKEKD